MAECKQRITVNLGGKYRREKLEGRDHLVVPCAMMEEGVLEGSEGAVFYPEDEIIDSIESWNGMPIVIDHPFDEVEDEFISARRADVYNSRKVGTLLETEYDGKLRTEAWFDEERTKEVDVRVYNSIIKKKRMETSTGLNADLDETPGTFKGQKYIGIARKFKPDHLAVLPNKIGAYSVAQGGGLFANTLSKEPEGFQKVALKSITEAVKSIGVEYINNEMSFNDASRAISEILAAEYGEPGKYWEGWITDLFPDYVVFWNGGKIWKQEYSTKDGKVTLTGEPVEVRRVVSYVANQAPPQERDMSKKFDKKKFVDRLITNGIATESDRSELESTPEKVLVMFETELETKEAEVEAERKKSKTSAITNKKKDDDDEEEEVTEEEAIRRLPKRLRRVLNRAERAENAHREKLIGVITNHKGNKFKKEWLEEQETDVLEGIATISATPNTKKKKDDDEDDDESPLVTNSRLDFSGLAGGSSFVANEEEEEDPDDLLAPLGPPKFKDPRKAADRD